MLRDTAWREVKKEWEAEARERAKLEVMRGLLAIDGKGRCVDVNCKRRRRILAKLRGGTAALRIETGRWGGLKREERLCRQCRLEEVEFEDVKHFSAEVQGVGTREGSGDDVWRIWQESPVRPMTGRWP